MPNLARPKVVVTRKLPDPIEARMGELFDVVLNSADRPMSADALPVLLQTRSTHSIQSMCSRSSSLVCSWM